MEWLAAIGGALTFLLGLIRAGLKAEVDRLTSENEGLAERVVALETERTQLLANIDLKTAELLECQRAKIADLSGVALAAELNRLSGADGNSGEAGP